MSANSLLPPSATAYTRSLEDVQCRRMDAIPLPNRMLWRPQDCPASVLPWLAWAFSVDEWDDTWDEQTQRDVIAESIEVHRIKGTPGGLRRALQAMGYKHVVIREGTTNVYDGSLMYGGSHTYGGDLGPYEFAVDLGVAGPMDAAAIALVMDRIERYKNVRSHLAILRTHTLLYDGAATYNGDENFNGGLADGFSTRNN